jgi:3-phenylpropionate/cinnamic acid dioxygenase small subunit
VELWELVCREQVRDVVSRYAIYVDSGRFDEMMPLFAPDATFLLEEREYRGHREIKSIFTKAAVSLVDHAGPRPMVRHMITTHEIVPLSETTARSRCYFLALAKDRLAHWGRYMDEFELVEGSWKITTRRVIVDGSADDGWVG